MTLQKQRWNGDCHLLPPNWPWRGGKAPNALNIMKINNISSHYQDNKGTSYRTI